MELSQRDAVEEVEGQILSTRNVGESIPCAVLQVLGWLVLLDKYSPASKY